MKLQLFLLSVLLIGALAHPVPDEEVSPLKAEIKSEEKPLVVEKLVEKPVDALKSTELRPAEEIKKPEEPIKEKVLLPASAPDAEIAQTLSEKKEEKLPVEKQTRAENKVGEVKALPVVAAAPVAGVEAEKPVVVEEAKPAVQVVQVIEGKSAGSESVAIAAAESPIAEVPASEQKKDELSASESAPAVKSDLPAPVAVEQPIEEPIALPAASAAAVAEKKDEQPARQERGNEQEINAAPAAAAETAKVQTNEEISNQIKTLNAEAPTAAVLPAAPTAPLAPAQAQAAIEAEQPIVQNELKSLAAEKPIENGSATAAAGDIPAAALATTAQESNLKALAPEAAALPIAEKQEQLAPAAAAVAAPAPEAKKIEAAPLAAAAPAAAAPLPIAADAEKPILPVAAEPAIAEPLKKLEEQPAVPLATAPLASTEEKKSEESKESKESKESESDSKESGETKEDKSN